jgi:hypothetical protein
MRKLLGFMVLRQTEPAKKFVDAGKRIPQPSGARRIVLYGVC